MNRKPLRSSSASSSPPGGPRAPSQAGAAGSRGAEGVGSLRFTLLGPVQAWRDEGEIPLGGPQQRAVLVALLLRRGRPVTLEQLVDALWEEPPAGAVPVLRTYVSRLRRVLDPVRERGAGSDVLRSSSSGYALSVPEGATDLDLFESEVAEAERHTGQGRESEAAEILRQALGRWSGTSLPGIPGPLAEAERDRLAELHLATQERLLELDLELGNHQRVVPELIRLTAAHPLRERLRQLLMLALYQCDRQAEALAVYHDTRRVLVEELGVEPAVALRDLHSRILAADPALGAPAVPRPRPAPAQKAGRVPAQLPVELPDFIGRAEETRKVVQELRDDHSAAMPVVVVTGMGGVGKTSLAVHAAHRAGDLYPDGQLYAELDGVDQEPVAPEVVLGRFLRALGEPDAAIRDSLAERAAQFRSLLAGRRMLIVLDNARNAEHVRSLLPGTPRCAVVVTSRSKLSSLPATSRVPLGVLRREAAVELFTRIVGGRRAGRETTAVEQLVELCGGLPLAIRIIASRHLSRPDWTVADTVEELRDERSRLAELELDDLAVEACFRLGYSRLKPEQARAFRLLSVVDVRRLTTAEAAALLAMEPPRARRLAESLVDVGMLESPARDSYRFHDLLWLFARERAQEEVPAEESRAALRRLLDFELATARAAYALIRPGHSVPTLVAATETSGLRFKDSAAAGVWGSEHFGSALAVARQMAESETAVAADLVLALDAVLEVGHLWRDLLPAAEAVAAAARRAGNRRAEGRVSYMLGGALMQLGQIDRAREMTVRAIELAESESDDAVLAMALNVVFICRDHNEPDLAYANINRGIAVARDIGDLSIEAMLLGNALQRHLSPTGSESDEGLLATAERLSEIYEQLGDIYGRSLALYRTAQVQVRVNRLDEALQQYQEAIQLSEMLGQRFLLAANLVRIASVHVSLGDIAAGVHAAERGIQIAHDLGHSIAVAVGQEALGAALAAMGQEAWARECRERALETYRSEGRQGDAARVERSLV